MTFPGDKTFDPNRIIDERPVLVRMVCNGNEITRFIFAEYAEVGALLFDAEEGGFLKVTEVLGEKQT